MPSHWAIDRSSVSLYTLVRSKSILLIGIDIILGIQNWQIKTKSVEPFSVMWKSRVCALSYLFDDSWGRRANRWNENACLYVCVFQWIGARYSLLLILYLCLSSVIFGGKVWARCHRRSPAFLLVDIFIYAVCLCLPVFLPACLAASVVVNQNVLSCCLLLLFDYKTVLKRLRTNAALH